MLIRAQKEAASQGLGGKLLHNRTPEKSPLKNNGGSSGKSGAKNIARPHRKSDLKK